MYSKNLDNYKNMEDMPVETLSVTDPKKSLHGKVIKFDGIKSLHAIPRRDDLLDKNMVNKTDSIINGGVNTSDCIQSRLLFLPNSFKEFHEKNESGKLEYKILIFGILPDGRKTAVILQGLVPYFEVRKPDDMDVNKFHRKVKGILDEKYRGSYTTELTKNGFNHYERVQSTYLRLHFTNLWDRKNALKYFAETLEWQTTTDDNNHFERVACRDNNFSMCAWNEIKCYKSFKKEDVCKLPRTFCVKYKDFVTYDGDITKNIHLSRDRTIVETWDIEAYTDTGEMPDADNVKDVCFMIGKTYHWKDSKDSLLDICLVSRPCNARPDKLTIVCKNEKELIKASFTLNSILMPDFIIGFNDGDFDWPFVIKKATKFGILIFIKDQLSLFNDYRTKRQSRRDQIESILKWDCQKKRIKLEADSVAYSTTLTLPGYINIDVRSMFRKLYPTEPKSSLKYYLEMSNLGGKEDMPISELFRIFKESMDLETEINEMVKNKDVKGLADVQARYDVNKEKMADVAHYCTIDAKRCQELLQKVNIIGDKREVSNVSHTTLYDALYFADGMKVRNLVIAEGQQRGILFSTRSKPYIGDGKYPGAYVFPPIKGPVKPKLTVRERKESQEEWKNVPEEDLVKMENAIYNKWNELVGESKSPSTGTLLQTNDAIRMISENNDFENDDSRVLFTNFVKEKNKYPISGLDFSSLYPSIIMTYNLSPEYMVFTEHDAEALRKEGHELHKIEFMFNEDPQIAWSIRHDTFDGEKLLPDKKENKFGLYPQILKKLFDKRSDMKKGMKVLAKRKEVMEKEGLQDTEEYGQVCFSYNYIDSKQKALKVFMNTFYGETGNKLSPFFVLAIAGGITSAGQRNIKMISSIVADEGCKLYYGDTDSCYISCPVKFFVKLDREYYGGQLCKKEYCTGLVKETFTQIDVIKKLANKHLIADNGTGFLKMAYEEVLYPCLFLLKKMYAGVEHQHIVNFEPHVDELFTKGLSLKRRGTSEVLKTVCKEVLMEILNINTTDTVRTIVQRKIKDIYDRDWEMTDFKKTAVYKPSKQNVSVRTFLKRMEDRDDPMCPIPQPGERFEYVVVKKYPFRYDMKGRKTKLKIGEMWEYYTYAKEQNLQIDLDYYMTGGIIGQFAQFVAYHPEFQVPPSDSTPEMYDVAEKKTLLTSKKYIEALCKTLSNTPVCQGPILKELYKLANASYKKTLQTVLGGTEGADQIKLMSFECTSGSNLYEYFRTVLSEESKKSAGYYAECYIEHMRKKYGKKVVYMLSKIFSNTQEPLLKYRTLYVAQVEDRARKTFVENTKGFMELFSSRDAIVEDLMSKMKSKLDLDELDKMSWGDNKIPDHKTFGANPKIADIVGGVSMEHKEFQLKLEAQKEQIALLYDIYNTLSASMTYLENTKAIVERLQYYISKERQENPMPPGITVVDENENAMTFIKRNLIEF
jgi:DNA polymerase elongation subunit (family B)